LFDKFGPIVPIPSTMVDHDNNSKQFHDYISIDLFACPTDLMEKISRETFHIYNPLKLQPIEHLSSNILNFVVVIGLAMLMYETNERVLNSKNSDGPLFHVDENKFIFRCNASIYRIRKVSG
jgi:hypothetical protein